MKKRHSLGRIIGILSGLMVGGAFTGCGQPIDGDGGAAPEEVQAGGAVEWPQLTSRVAENPQLEARLDQLLEQMTLEEKVGQLFQAELRAVTPEDVREYHLGSILNGGGAFPNNNKHSSVDDWVALADSFYAASMDTSDGGTAVPIIWGTDAVHGHNNVIGATLYPHNIALGATRNPDLIREIGKATAAEVAATGIDWDFSPTLAVARDDRWGRTYESYSEDPAVVKSYGGPMVEGLQGDPQSDGFLSGGQVIATAKHFIADGGTRDGIDRGDADISEEELMKIHAPGYFTAIEAGVQTVMASFSSWQGEKLHGHEYLLTDVLKKQMGFDGFVIGDWNGHQFVNGCSNTSCPQAINAGIDMFMAPDGDWKKLYASTLAQAKDGTISSGRLNDAVRRILRVKLRADLFERGAPSERALAGDESVIGAPEHRAVARRAVRESLVLLKNRDQLLPLARDQRVLVAGDGADNIGKQAGGWSVTWQGTGTDNSDFPGATSIYDGIAEAVTSAGGEAVLSEDGSFERKPDVAIVVFGEDPYAEMQGDIANLDYSDDEDLALLRKLHAQDVPVVSLFITGRPLWVNPEINASDAFAVIWQPGTEGGGVADVVFRDARGEVNHDFVGKLPFTWPENAVPTPRNLADSGQALFPYGYGLDFGERGIAAAQLPEESGLTRRDIADALPVFEGRALDPWSLEVVDIANNRQPITTSIAELDGIRVQSVDRNVQEDSRRLQWSGQGPASVGFFANSRTDLSAYLEADGALVFDVKVDKAPSSAASIGMNCGTDCLATQPVTDLLRAAEPGQWGTVSVALQCMAEQGAQMDMVLSPFFMLTEGEMDVSVNSIRIATDVEADIQCG
ncbi:glycoside hydrolase family 3 protein [Microbulbifer halophilus]|uniref:Exo 1,3/1,4-beta-D-glucan glucohydrolase n=1 Tax=Microbulbifer halophilus TaxID=453963 RepID=A0ABW5E723_9GAMM|nr:glycoside hydrolase family 3 N-terminal domain-containing protein [Microbulbifer halophilus]MCW8125911.1 putative glycoside hydrolase [Microbulbifer halophilus]